MNLKNNNEQKNPDSSVQKPGFHLYEILEKRELLYDTRSGLAVAYDGGWGRGTSEGPWGTLCCDETVLHLGRDFMCVSVQFTHSVMSDSLRPHGLWQARPPCPSPTPGVDANSCPLSRWRHPNILSCLPLLLLSSVFPSIKVFSSESALHIRWPKYWSFSLTISPSNEYSGLSSLRTDRLDLLAVLETLKSLLQHHSSKASVLRHSAFFMVQLSHPYMTPRKTIPVLFFRICWKSSHDTLWWSLNSVISLGPVFHRLVSAGGLQPAPRAAVAPGCPLSLSAWFIMTVDSCLRLGWEGGSYLRGNLSLAKSIFSQLCLSGSLIRFLLLKLSMSGQKPIPLLKRRRRTWLCKQRQQQMLPLGKNHEGIWKKKGNNYATVIEHQVGLFHLKIYSCAAFIKLYWTIVELHCCVNFCYTVKCRK